MCISAVGREFHAIFVSTTEATDENGCCKNPTKSMANKFVFNTVITRAQSLVVCIGNPYFLCHLDKSSEKHWATYINNCLECETFTLLNSNFSEVEKEKLQNILNLNSGHTKQELSSGDKIIKGYLNSLAKFEKHRKFLDLSKSWGDIRWVDCDYSGVDYDDDDDDDDVDDDIDYDDDSGCDDDDGDYYEQDSTLFDSHIKCVINFHTRYQALAQSVKNHKFIIHIDGQKNLRGAFHESTVLVELLDSPSDPQRQNGKKIYNGKVVKLISLSNPTFLCEVDHENFSRFYPINKKDPALFNLPILSKVDGVAVFDLQSLKDVPRVVQVFPAHIARKRIFFVQYLHWDLEDNKYKLPVGMVIDSVSKGYTYNAGERLLCAQYKFDFVEVNKIFNTAEPIQTYDTDEVFTITEKSDEILENAFSVQHVDGDTYVISYYVINIAGYIKDRELTDLLKMRGVSAFVKTDKLNKWKLHSMFPPLLLQSLNFDLKNPRLCFKVSCLAEVKGEVINYKPLKETPVKEVFGLLTKIYTLKEMESQMEKQFEFKVLFHIAQCLQLKRLDYNEAMYNCVYDILEAPRARLVLKVFASWANSLAAVKLAGSSLTLFPLHCKVPPSTEEKQLVYDRHGDALRTSLHNKYFLPKNGYNLLSDVKINSKALPLLIKALEDENTFKYLAMLAYDNFFPQFHVASQNFRSIEKAKEFVLCSKTDKINIDISTDLPYYTTKFTSPLTSYFDVVIQDMLSAAINVQSSKYNRNELDLMCVKANKDFKRKIDFEESMFNLQLGVTLKAFNHRIDGYINSVDSKNKLTLSFPSHELKSLSEHQLSFNVAHLLALKSSSSLSKLYEWNVIVASFDGPPSIFTSPKIILDRLRNADASIDITSFLASSDNEKSHFNTELTKKQMDGCVESSTVSVSQDEWQTLTKLISSKPTEEEKQCKDALEILKFHSKRYLLKKNIEQITKQTVFWSGTVGRKLQQKYDVLHTWFGAAKDTALVYPKIQQIEIAPFLKICIQHNSEPEKCFANISLVNASKKTYENINEYMELWGQVVIAENAVSSVRTRDILLLENVYLQWPELEYCCDTYAGDYYRVPTNEFVIMKPPIDFNKSNTEIFDLQRGDLLCVQYEVPDEKLEISMGFVFHMFVDKVLVYDFAANDISKESDSDEDSGCESSVFNEDDSIEYEKEYYLSFSHNVEKISEKFKNLLTNKVSKPRCTVQVLHISPPQRFVILICKCANMWLILGEFIDTFARCIGHPI